ncbi:hypothetical protein [uncultured Paraglaciecola sp.]|uniref:hypothetical protein n=1 Tax=uncultured Paraglaciecola sp. TaxID=1765024 RepID=UPI0030D9AF44
MLETRWEPDFPFTDEIRVPVFGEAMPHANITTACFISRKEFKYEYIEIKSKAADAEITSAFRSISKDFNFDFFEKFGDHRDLQKLDFDTEL